MRAGRFQREEASEAHKQLIQQALNGQCGCGDRQSKGLKDAVLNQCSKCTAARISEAHGAKNGLELLLSTAVKLQNPDIVAMLMPYQWYQKNDNGKYAFEYAVQQNNPALWELFPESQISGAFREDLTKVYTAKCICDGGSGSLATAALTQCLACIAKFISQAGQRGTGQTALIQAAQAGKTSAVSILRHLEAKRTAESGRTAMMYAAQNNHIACVRLLLDFEKCLKKEDGMTALMIASQYAANKETVQFLAQYEAKFARNDGWTALMMATSCGHLDHVKVLAPLESGIQRPDGWTALMLACQNGHTGCAEVLLETQEALLSAKNGTTIHIAAALSNQGAILGQLVRFYAAHPEIPAPWGQKRSSDDSAAAIALSQGHYDSLCVLLQFKEERAALNLPVAATDAFLGNLAAISRNPSVDSAILEIPNNGYRDETRKLGPLWFSILGGQRRCVNYLIRRKQHAHESIESSLLALQPKAALRMLCVLKDDVSTAVMDSVIHKSLYQGDTAPLQYLRHFFPLNPEYRGVQSIVMGLSNSGGPARVETGLQKTLRLLKNHGVLGGVASLRGNTAFPENNPLAKKQFDIAEAQILRTEKPFEREAPPRGRKGRHQPPQPENPNRYDPYANRYDEIPPEKHFAYREQAREAAFNRAAMLEALECGQDIQRPARVLVAPQENRIYAKLRRHRDLMVFAVRFVMQQLAEELAE